MLPKEVLPELALGPVDWVITRRPHRRLAQSDSSSRAEREREREREGEDGTIQVRDG